MTDKMAKTIEEFEAVRAKATQKEGGWYTEDGMYPDRYGTSNAIGSNVCVYSRADATFIAESANRATHFTAALKVSLQAMQDIKNESYQAKMLGCAITYQWVCEKYANTNASRHVKSTLAGSRLERLKRLLSSWAYRSMSCLSFSSRTIAVTRT